MPSVATIKRFLAAYRHLGEVVATTLVLIAGGTWLAVHLRHKTVGAWAPVVVAVVLLLAYAIDRFRRARAPGLTDRAIQELEVAKTYLKHVRDFMEGLRLSAIGLRADEALPKLEALRQLVFDAIIQGINSDPGEHIRCALFEPQIDDSGETVFRVRAHRGHTHRVEHLTLHTTSVAGVAYAMKESVYVPDASKDPRVETTTAGRPVNTLYCLPLYTFRADRVEVAGVFSVASNRVDAFSESDRAFISACSDMVAVVEFFIHVWEQAAAVQIQQQQQPAAVHPPSEQLEAGPENEENR